MIGNETVGREEEVTGEKQELEMGNIQTFRRKDKRKVVRRGTEGQERISLGRKRLECDQRRKVEICLQSEEEAL